jgi:hypothetical protein
LKLVEDLVFIQAFNTRLVEDPEDLLHEPGLAAYHGDML